MVRVGHFHPFAAQLAWEVMIPSLSLRQEEVTAESDVALIGLPPQPKTPAQLARGASWSEEIWGLLRYLAQTEVHTYAFSVAANAILSLFPFIVLMFTVANVVFHSQAMENAIADMIRYFLPAGQVFVTKNMEMVANARKEVQFVPDIMLL